MKLIFVLLVAIWCTGCGGSDTANEYITNVSDIQDGSVIVQIDTTSSGSVTESSWKYNVETGNLEQI